MNASLPTYVIINPASRSGYGLKLWNRLAPLFRTAGVSCKPVLSSVQKGITAIAEEISQTDEMINIIVLGGDGTLNEVVNGIRDFDTVNLGYIPIGSANDFGKAVGITDPEEAVRTMIGNDAPVLRDLGVVSYYIEGTSSDAPSGTRYFNISTGIGFDADCCWLSDHTCLKKFLNRLHLGSLIYLTSALRLIIANRRARHTVADSGASRSFNRSMFTVCMNTGYEGGGFRFCPDADPSDGVLSLCNADGIGRLGFFLLFPKAYGGAHIGCKGIFSTVGTAFTVTSDRAQHFHADGEVIDEKVTKLEVGILPGKVRWLL